MSGSHCLFNVGAGVHLRGGMIQVAVWADLNDEPWFQQGVPPFCHLWEERESPAISPERFGKIGPKHLKIASLKQCD